MKKLISRWVFFKNFENKCGTPFFEEQVLVASSTWKWISGFFQCEEQDRDILLTITYNIEVRLTFILNFWFFRIISPTRFKPIKQAWLWPFDNILHERVKPRGLAFLTRQIYFEKTRYITIFKLLSQKS